jgi:hypothetical protein
VYQYSIRRIEKKMKKTLLTSWVIFTVLFAVSCKSTGTVSSAQDGIEAPPDSQSLEAIYDQYETGIILTGAKSYTVVRGDALVRIATSHYGTGNGAYFPLIIAASNEEILDPDQIEPGMILTVPDLQANLNNANARANLKSLIKAVADFYTTKPESKTAQQTLGGLNTLYNSL